MSEEKDYPFWSFGQKTEVVDCRLLALCRYLLIYFPRDIGNRRIKGSL
jgi:hypothetical protein